MDKPQLVSERPEIAGMSAEDRKHYQACVTLLAQIFARGPVHLKVTVSAVLRSLWLQIYSPGWPKD